MPDRLEVEAELIGYYGGEAEARARRPLDEQRLEAGRRFVEEIDRSLPVLELGTGAGRDVRVFVAEDLTVFGVDLSLEQARYSQEAGARQLVASARHLPFPDRTFSSLWSMSTLMHVPNSSITATLSEVRRVLAPGAVAAIGVWGGPDIEDHDDHSRIGQRRLFSRRTDETWRGFLSLIGEVFVYETWDGASGDLWYQWTLLRVP